VFSIARAADAGRFLPFKALFPALTPEISFRRQVIAMNLAEGRDYTVIRARFPNKANAAAVVDNRNGTFTVFLNTLFSAEDQQKALAHELRHIASGDFSSVLPIPELEARADGLLPPVPGDPVPFFPSESALADWIIFQAAARGMQS